MDEAGSDKAAAWKAAAIARMGSMSDDELDDALRDFVETADGVDMTELLSKGPPTHIGHATPLTPPTRLSETMNEQNVITWDEAERILSDGKPEVVKSGLPQQVRPSDPENSTNVEECIQRLLADDPRLVEVNLNNMKARFRALGCLIWT